MHSRVRCSLSVPAASSASIGAVPSAALTDRARTSRASASRSAATTNCGGVAGSSGPELEPLVPEVPGVPESDPRPPDFVPALAPAVASSARARPRRRRRRMPLWVSSPAIWSSCRPCSAARDVRLDALVASSIVAVSALPAAEVGGGATSRGMMARRGSAAVRAAAWSSSLGTLRIYTCEISPLSNTTAQQSLSLPVMLSGCLFKSEIGNRKCCRIGNAGGRMGGRASG